MKNITISITETVEQYARKEAAKAKKSLSRFISELLTSTMKRRENAEDWISSFESEKPYINSTGYKFNREELYDRKSLR